MAYLKAISKLTLFALWCLVLVPPQIIVLLFNQRKIAYVIPMIWHKGVCRIFNIQVQVRGHPEINRQVMYISNHLSYLDIPVMGSFLAASFIAKKEVAAWPVFGFLSKLQQTAFIDRTGEKVKEDAYDIGQMLDKGKSLILFPEGTSTDGREVLPFRSRFIGVVLERVGKVLIQPITVRLPDATTQESRDRYAWYGDMEMPPHLWYVAKSNGICVELIFHLPIEVSAQTERRRLAESCRAEIANAL